MDLNQQIIEARTRYEGEAAFTMPTGQILKIETTPDGSEILNVVVPVGKAWSVRIRVDVEEANT